MTDVLLVPAGLVDTSMAQALSAIAAVTAIESAELERSMGNVGIAGSGATTERGRVCRGDEASSPG
jgi:hypothetical protein